MYFSDDATARRIGSSLMFQIVKDSDIIKGTRFKGKGERRAYSGGIIPLFD